MAEVCDKYLDRGIDRRQHSAYINKEIEKEKEKLLNFLLLLLIPAKIVLGCLLIYWMIKLMIN